jgi:hypothetical protein
MTLPADEEFLKFFFRADWDGVIHGLPFSLRFKIMDLGFTCYNNQGGEGLSLSFKTCQQLGKNDFSLGFVFCRETPMNIKITKIANDVTDSARAED